MRGRGETHQHDDALEDHIRSLSDDVQDVGDQLFKLFRRDLVEDPANPSEEKEGEDRKRE